MKTLELKEALKSLSEYINDLDKEILVLTSNKKPIAAVVSLKYVDRESLSLSTNQEFIKIIDESRKDFKQGKKLSLADMKEEIKKM
jgi:PHD/YefM family antitoxin component YafN of YafNO toxin-antitoxin module